MPTAAVPIVSYQCAIGSLAAEAFPSYTFRRGASVTGEVVGLLRWPVSPTESGTVGHSRPATYGDTLG